MKILIIAALTAIAALAQPSITTGPNAPSASDCQSLQVGNLYVRSENPSNGPIHVLRCTQTGSAIYAWQPVGHIAQTTAPGKCSVGDLWFDTDATAGANLYGCTAAPGTWTVISGAGTPGTVTSVGFTGGLISVATATTTPAFTVAGTSGGIPYFSAAATWASSGALTANLPVIGGGAGIAPSVGTVSGNTTAFVTTTGAQTSGNCVSIDASGNHIANGAACTAAALTGTSPSIGGGALIAGACASDTVTITGAATTMAVLATPVAYPGDGAYWAAYVSAADTVTVKVCGAIALTPSASTYRVRVII